MSRAFSSACSGDMYSSVPTTCPKPVNRVRVGELLARRLGHAKVDHLGHGLAVVAGDQHVARLDIAVDHPFWWACWIAWQTGTNSSSRSRGADWWSSQYLVIGMPLTSSMTK